MKKYAIIGIVMIVIVVLSFGFERDEKLVFNEKINLTFYEDLKTNQTDLIEFNNEKFGRDLDKSSINFKINDLIVRQENSRFTELSATGQGVLHLPEGNFDFNFEGMVYKVTLSNGKVILSGGLEGDIVNKAGEDKININLLYDYSTEKVYLGVTNGHHGELAALPFGNSKLSLDEINEINSLIAN
ncbi:hypothetical protein MKY84_06400 [Chryseomicrobium sp. FSL W7-1435]|uniref:hypothetical protein n=1 Tax=Chryseomicrobium sp. FSL W7-1435 TaxID=2921704 RepID=UPI00315A9513